LRRKSKIVPKESLEAAVYAFGEEVRATRLRPISRFAQSWAKDLIVTHRGIGHMLEP
jgi:two-component system OmpR family response regulator